MEPLKLMCVSNKNQWNPTMPKVPILSKVTAIDECTFEGMKYWRLQEFDGGCITWWYDKRDFATLPDQSADEMQEENHEAIIYAR